METLPHETLQFSKAGKSEFTDGSNVNSSALLAELESLRNLVEDLGERREEDRRSILILQSQIDHMRGYKCSDSLETSFQNVYAVANVLWNQLPSISLRSLLKSGKKKKKGLSSKSTSCNSSKLSTSRSKRDHPFRVSKLGMDDDEIRVLS